MKLDEIVPQSLEKSKDTEVLSLWRRLNQMWANLLKGKRYDREELQGRGAFVLSEMERRKFEVSDSDFLKALKEFKRKAEARAYQEIYPSLSGSNGKITLEEMEKFYTKPIKIVENVVNFVGSVVIHGESENDFEMLVNLPDREELIRRIFFRLSRALPDQELREKLHLLDDLGPFTDFLPRYHLTLEPVESDIIRMSDLLNSPATASILKEAARISVENPQALIDAKRAAKKDQLSLGKFFFPMKTSLSSIMAYREGEVYSIDAAVEELRKVAQKKKLDMEIIPCYLQKKYDGTHCQIHKLKDKVVTYSEMGRDITDRLPNIASKVKALKPDELILDGELEYWKGGQHQPREETSAYLHEKSKPDDSEFIMNIFDVLWFDIQMDKREEGDIHKKPSEYRLNKLEALNLGQSVIGKPDTSLGLNKAPTDRVETIAELRRSLNKFSKAMASEGAMIKFAGSTYRLRGTTTELLKYKKYAEIHGKVWQVNETSEKGIYNYDFALSFGPRDRINEGSIVKIGAMRYTKAGRSYNTTTKCKIGDVITLRYHTVNLYEDPETGTRSIHYYEPIFFERTEALPDSFSRAVLSGEESGLLTKKSGKQKFSKVKEARLEEQADQYLTYPDERLRYRAVMQHHYRGRSCHNDFRVENEGKKLLIGWTLNDQLPGAIKEPVLTMADAKRIDANPERYFKINYKTGEWKERKTRAGNIVNTEIVAEPKAPEPLDWLTFEGITKPGEVGATKGYPGVFNTIQRGEVEYGAQKPYLHEYFLHMGPLNYRLVLRQLRLPKGEESEDLTEAVLPPAEEKGLGGVAGEGWVAIKPLDQTPYVLTRRAVNQKWVPPAGISALPRAIRNQIPVQFQYWKEKEKKKILAARDALFEAIKKEEVKLKEALRGRFVLQHQWFRGPMQVRFGPSAQYWFIRIDHGESSFPAIKFTISPEKETELSVTFKREKTRDYMVLGRKVERIRPGHSLNPTKETPSFITIQDSGTIEVLSDSDTFKKFNFHGKKLKGLWVMKREDPKSEWWVFSRSETIGEKGGKEAEFTEVNYEV